MPSLAAPHAPYLDAVVQAFDTEGWTPHLVKLTSDHEQDRLVASVTVAGVRLVWSPILGWCDRRPDARRALPMPTIADPADVVAAAVLLIDSWQVPPSTAVWQHAADLERALAARRVAIAAGEFDHSAPATERR